MDLAWVRQCFFFFSNTNSFFPFSTIFFFFLMPKYMIFWGNYTVHLFVVKDYKDYIMLQILMIK